MSDLTRQEHIAVHAENAELLNRLKYKSQVIQNLSNTLDRELKKKVKIRNILHDVHTGKMTDGTALSYIRAIVGVKR